MSKVTNDSRRSFFPNSKTARAKETAKKQYERLAETQSEQNKPMSARVSSSVQIPEGLKDFSRIKELASHAPEMDNSAKIQMLQEQLNDGTYKINYDKLAEQLLLQELS